jgi:alpha-glucoside transport system substrate-binding protein
MTQAETAVTRTLSAAECETYYSAPCPARVELPDDLGLRRGFDAYGAGIGSDGLAGTTVRVSAVPVEDDGFASQLAAFSRLTGIRVEVTPVEAQAAVSFESVEPGLRPDVVVVANEVPEWARSRAIDVTRYLDSDTLRSDYGDYLLRVGTSGIDGTTQPDDRRVLAVPLKAEVKGMVFYPKTEFEEAGYVVPTTWDELIELSDRIVADGGNPWCFGFEAGTATGWPGTDLIESLVLRTGGADVYDAWTRGDVGFTSADVMEAGRLANAQMFTTGYVRGGSEAVNGQSFAKQLDFMLARDSVTEETVPECWLYHQAAFALNTAPAGSQLGTDLDFFVLPPVDASQPTPMIGTAIFASGIVDRPEVRALLEFMASPQWGEAWAREAHTVFTPTNRRFDTSNFGNPAVDPAAAVYTRVATATTDALQSDAFRFDASDLMPPAIGGAALDDEAGAFWQGMVDWSAGTRTIEQVFADIDDAWAALRAQDESPPAGP